jgi:hypothetical protein
VRHTVSFTAFPTSLKAAISKAVISWSVEISSYMESTDGRSSGYLLDDINVSGHAEFSELVPKHRSVESELSSSDRFVNVTTRRGAPIPS